MSLQHRDVASRRTISTALPLYHSSQLRIKRKGDMVRTHSRRLRVCSCVERVLMSVSVTVDFTKHISMNLSDLQAYVKHHAELRGNKIFLYPDETEYMVRKLPFLKILHVSVQQLLKRHFFSAEESEVCFS